MQQRDAFISEIHAAALRDSRITIISADFGAPALDKFREECPGQFIHAGISEQNAVNVAVGMALAGKRVYLYWMAPFFLRCFEQLKLAAFHGVPLTVVPVGVGFSYAGAGPTHYATEDIACLRTLVNSEVYTCSTANLARFAARQSLKSEKMTVVRLERGEFPELYPDDYDNQEGYESPYREEPPCIASGYLVHWLRAQGRPVIDLFRVKPISPLLVSELSRFDHIYTYEEQYPQGGMSSAILEALNDYGGKTRVLRRALPDRAIYENGTRDELLEVLC